MYHFYVQGEMDGTGGTSACHYESMTEQTNTFRYTNKYHGKLTGVNLVRVPIFFFVKHIVKNIKPCVSDRQNSYY